MRAVVGPIENELDVGTNGGETEPECILRREELLPLVFGPIEEDVDLLYWVIRDER